MEKRDVTTLDNPKDLITALEETDGVDVQGVRLHESVRSTNQNVELSNATYGKAVGNIYDCWNDSEASEGLSMGTNIEAWARVISRTS